MTQTDITALTIQPEEIAISNNEQYVYWTEFLKKVTRAIGQAEKLREVIKGKMVGYKATQEIERHKQETLELRQARALNQPAIVTRMIPEVPNVHYRKKLKWRVKNLKTVPRAYLTTDDKGITAAVKALGKKANIRGIKVYEDESVVVM